MKVKLKLFPIIFVALFAITVMHADAQEKMYQSQNKKVLIVGTKEAAPFAMKNSDGQWSGISIELWKKIAEQLEISYEFSDFNNLTDLLDAVKRGSVDLAIAAMTITAEREKAFDFTHPFYTTGLSIAVASEGKRGILYSMSQMISPDFLKAVGVLVFVLLVVGLLIWLLEGRKNQTHFGGGIIKGISSGFWWSAVTMTTVGYGDKVPVTFLGRLLGVIWMFTAIIIISSFTAAIASSFTVNQLRHPVEGLEDLPKVNVGTLEGSTSESYLKKHLIAYTSYKNTEQGIEAVVNDKVDAFVYDMPILKYMIRSKFQGKVVVLPEVFQKQFYGIAFPTGSQSREEINQHLLEITNQSDWKNILKYYLGE